MEDVNLQKCLPLDPLQSDPQLCTVKMTCIFSPKNVSCNLGPIRKGRVSYGIHQMASCRPRASWIGPAAVLRSRGVCLTQTRSLSAVNHSPFTSLPHGWLSEPGEAFCYFYYIFISLALTSCFRPPGAAVL